jgi:hypothetical protein
MVTHRNTVDLIWTVQAQSTKSCASEINGIIIFEKSNRKSSKLILIYFVRYPVLFKILSEGKPPTRRNAQAFVRGSAVVVTKPNL